MAIDVPVARICEILGRQIEKAAQIMDDDAISADRRARERRKHASAVKQLTEIRAVLNGKLPFALISAEVGGDEGY